MLILISFSKRKLCQPSLLSLQHRFFGRIARVWTVKIQIILLVYFDFTRVLKGHWVHSRSTVMWFVVLRRWKSAQRAARVWIAVEVVLRRVLQNTLSIDFLFIRWKTAFFVGSFDDDVVGILHVQVINRWFKIWSCTLTWYVFLIDVDGVTS